MGKYKYKAMNTIGKKIDGTYNANSKDEVFSMLSANGFYPLKVEEVVESTEIEMDFLERVNTKDIAVFCRQLYTMLDAGVTINNALNILAEQLSNKKLKKAVREIEDKVKKGESLSKAMSNYPKVFPGLLVTMVESGEVSGNLDTVMLRMCGHYEKENKINNKIKGAMTYPIILSIVAVVVVIFLFTYIMPTFLDMFEDAGTELPGSTKFLIWMTEFVAANGLAIGVVFTAIIVAITLYIKTEHGKYTTSRLKLMLPILKPLNEKIIVSRFSRTLSTLLASGVSMGQALQIISGVVGNKIAEDALIEVKEHVFKGEGLSNPIRDAKIFPLMLSTMIKIGEETGSMDEILEKTADFYDDEVDQAITTATTMIEPLLIIVMGVVIGFIIISIMLPLFSMYTTI